MVLIREILSLFEKVTGLTANYAKSQGFPIHCTCYHIFSVRDTLRCKIADFPCTSLVVSLSICKLPKAAVQLLVNKVARRLPPWKGRLLNRNDHLILAKSTLAAIPVHISMAISVAPWATKAIKTLIRGFLWCGSEVASGDRCAVAWINVSCPTNLGAWTSQIYTSWDWP